MHWLIVALTVSLLSATAHAQGKGQPEDRPPTSPGVAARVAELEAQVAALTAALDAEISARLAGDTQLQASLSSEAMTSAEAEAALIGRVTDLEETADFAMALEAFVTIDPDPINDLVGPHIVFESANVHVRSGSGSTDDGCTFSAPNCASLTGLGNLILGYNEPEPSQNLPVPRPVGRTGSHNLVVGSEHGFTSFGGLVAGEVNAVTGAYSSVSGGRNNDASGMLSSVSGGHNNDASGALSSVSGGDSSEASGVLSSVSGGYNNHASGSRSSVSGGRNNDASGILSSVSGGTGREAPDEGNWAAGSLLEPN